MLVLDNIIYNLQSRGGITSYWRAVCKGVMTSDLNYRMVSNESSSPYFWLRLFKRYYLKYLGRYLPAHTRGCIVFHSSYLRVHRSRRVKNVLTIHDMIYERFDTGLRRYIHVWQKKRALSRADAVICVSNNTKMDLELFYPNTRAKKVFVVYNGVDKKTFFPLHNRGDERDYVLIVGGRSVHKNFDHVLELMSSQYIRKTGLRLKVVGPEFTTDERNKISEYSISSVVEHCGAVTDTELNILYNNAYCLLYPSLYEGFGIPPLEAMSAGCPVLCTRESSLPEVVGESGLYVDGRDVNHTIEQIRALSIKGIRENVVSMGFEQSSKFSWERTAEETIKIYKTLLA